MHDTKAHDAHKVVLDSTNTVQPESQSNQLHLRPPRFFRIPPSLSPQSQSLFLRYGSKLPTALTYIVLKPEASNLGDRLRIWVRPVWKIILPHTDFQGATREHLTPQKPRCFTGVMTLSRYNNIPGSALLTKKR